ncbi:uncharacterized protein [Drosophila virilis]|uniref:Uncharacterized protein, isoform A n=1 Tax=Drosophila virilis TaxID=7244 RepID=B4LIY9_DROVI|nr:uncharacterized protein LOC6625171 [Drosophila virilis]EDW60439.2 uncharacterized protein Dvir_GJ20861, isoform A [Drosophila virilis]
MYIQLTMRLILALVLSQGAHPVRADIADVGHYSQTLVDSILDIYAGNGSNRRSATVDLDDSEEDFETTPIVPTYIYPYLLLALWVACISCIICCCLYCKCQQADNMTAYNSNSFELQEVHVLDHPLPHVKGCVCLGCLQRQVAKELQLKREQ